MQNWQTWLDKQISTVYNKPATLIIPDETYVWAMENNYKIEGIEFKRESESENRPDTRDKVLNFWRNPHDTNTPYYYMKPELKYRSFLIYGLIKYAGLHINSTILEMGCNAGRNLNFLKECGFNYLTGVDIYPIAIDMIKGIEAYAQSIESFVEVMPHYDCIFSLATFEHIHSDNDWVFEKIADKAKYVITVANEHNIGMIHFKRNYKKVFEPFGFKQIFELDCNFMFEGCIARIMEKQ